MTTSHWMRPHTFKTPDSSADVVIVGAGYVGLSIAYWLSEYRPDLKLVVLDRALMGSGASGRNAGFLTKGSATFYKSLVDQWGRERALELYRFGEESLSLVQQHLLRSSPEVKALKTTSLTLAQSEAVRTNLATSFAPEDFGFEWRNESELSPILQKKFFGAYENGGEYQVNPMQLLGSLKTTLEARKISVVENTAAFELTPEGVSTEVQFFRAKQVILALNGYFPQFHAAFRPLIKPYRAQMLAVELDESFETTSLHYDSPERVYWRRAGDRSLVIGGKRLLDEAGEVGDFEKVNPVVQAGLEDYLNSVLKVRYKVIHRWSGTMGFTDHELPYSGKIEAPLEAFAIGGFSGHGMGFGFRSAQDLVDVVTGKKDRTFFDSFSSAKIKL